MPFRFEEGFTDAVEAFEHGAMCVLPGPDLGGFAPPVAEALCGLFTGAALHAVLIAAVDHPEWAVAWRDALPQPCRDDCEQYAEAFLAAAPISFQGE